MGVFSPKLSLKQTAELCESLGTLTRGGIPVIRAFTLLSQERKGRVYKRILPPIIHALQQGANLDQALRAESKYLPDYFIEMMAVGEVSGKLETVLNDLSAYYADMVRQRRKYVEAILYFVLLLIVAFVIIPYVWGVVFTHDSLEIYTLKFIWARVKAWGPPFLVIWILARLGLLRRLTDPIFSRIWPTARIWHRLALAKFCRSMAILMDAGLGIRQCIERSAAVTTHPRLRHALRRAVPMVQQGESLQEALMATGILTEMVGEMIRIGEYSGKEEELFDKCAEYLYNETLHRFQSIAYALEGTLLFLIFISYVFGGYISHAAVVLLRFITG